MITWMQRHKKYLVVTIWVSTIAFVGAGFVGWGSVDFNISRANYVATVGDTGVSKKEFDRAFSRLFYQQNMLADGTLTQEQALKMGLDRHALYGLLQQKILLNFADEIGLKISDEMLAKEIVKSELFADEKGFSKAKYEKALREMGYSKSDYETELKNQMLISALMQIFSQFSPSEEQANMLAALASAQDYVQIKRIKAPQITPNDEQLRKYYEENKSSFKSEQTYELAVSKVSPAAVSDEQAKEYFEQHKYNYKREDGKLKSYEEAKGLVAIDAGLAAAQKEAKLLRIALKKDASKFQSVQTVGERDEVLSFVQDLPVGEVSKEFEHDGKWVIAMIKTKHTPKQLSFEEAKERLKQPAALQLRDEALQKAASEQLNDFRADVQIGWMGKFSAPSALSESEFAALSAEVFGGKKRGYVLLDDEAIMYEITDKKLGDKKASAQEIEQLKALANYQIQSELLERLAAKYPVKIYYKGNQ